MINGDRENEAVKKLQKIGELLQFDQTASAYLMAEFSPQAHAGGRL